MRIRRICCLTNLGTTPLVSSEVVMEQEQCPFSLGNIILLKEKGGMRESFPRQVDRESRGPQGERGLEFSRREKGQTFFLSPHSLGLYNKVPKVRMLIYVHTYTQTHPHLGTVLYTFMKFKVKNTVQLI